MQTTEKKEEKPQEIQKLNNYVPNDNPTSRSAYTLIESIEKEILILATLFIPTIQLRTKMDYTRRKLKSLMCDHCKYIGENIRSKTKVQIFNRDDKLSDHYGRIIKTEHWVQSKKCSMACEGCRVLKLKQIATGFIKNRRFKQI